MQEEGESIFETIVQLNAVKINYKIIYFQFTKF